MKLLLKNTTFSEESTTLQKEVGGKEATGRGRNTKTLFQKNTIEVMLTRRHALPRGITEEQALKSFSRQRHFPVGSHANKVLQRPTKEVI